MNLSILNTIDQNDGERKEPKILEHWLYFLKNKKMELIDVEGVLI